METSFLNELRVLASQSRRIPSSTQIKMTTRPVLLGIRRKKTSDDGGCQYERALREPRDIIIADDMDSYQLFKDAIFVVPHDGLEGEYALSPLVVSG